MEDCIKNNSLTYCFPMKSSEVVKSTPSYGFEGSQTTEMKKKKKGLFGGLFKKKDKKTERAVSRPRRLKTESSI